MIISFTHAQDKKFALSGTIVDVRNKALSNIPIQISQGERMTRSDPVNPPLIRGLGFNRVVVLEKGIKHEGQQWGVDHGLKIDQFATGDIEVVKGAASFLYGSDAIGGVIDIKPEALPNRGSVLGSLDLIGKSNNALYGTSFSIKRRAENWVYGGRITFQSYDDDRVPSDAVHVYDYSVRLYKQRARNTAGREFNIHVNAGYVTDNFWSVFYVSSNSSKSDKLIKQKLFI